MLRRANWEGGPAVRRVLVCMLLIQLVELYGAPASRRAWWRQHALAARPPAQYDTCASAVQPDLRYGISGRTRPDVPMPVDPGESLATAVCCDSRAAPFAEPQNTYMNPDIALFRKLGPGVTTFYDSACGIPLFKAPLNRSFHAFEADTREHGWPSFRTAEVVAANVRIDETTKFVTSACGTHLGTYLPDAEGPRWCIDLACVAGNPTSPTADAN